MSAGGGEVTKAAVAARQRAGLVSGLKRLQDAPSQAQVQPRGEGERCDLCGRDLNEDHRHMLQLEERRIDCACDSCWSLRSGDPEYRPVGTRIAWLPELQLSDETWAGFGIPIGLAFFMRSSTAGRVVGLYPSPAGATECELDLAAWEGLCEANPILHSLESDAEGLVVNRMTSPHQYAIAPIDLCYGLVGLVKANWDGISGGTRIEGAIAGFFEELRRRSAP
jgi:hypothetical protein